MEGGSHYSSSVEQATPPREAGGWRAVKFIIGNESFEKLASMGLQSNITVYLRSEYNMGSLLLVNVVNIWSGLTNFAPLAGAFLSDAYLGRFKTLLFGSFATLLGMGTMTLTAGIHQLRPSACRGRSDCQKPQKWQLGVLFAGLGLISAGAGGIRPCNIAFGADQFDTTTEEGKSQLNSFFNWWYFSFTVALIIALTAVVYIQTDVSWVVGYAIPTVCLALSILVFLLGTRTYIYVMPRGSVFIDIAKVIIAALSKGRQVPSRSSELSFFDPPMNETSPPSSRLMRTDRFKFFDRAALITNPDELNGEGVPKNNWRLCSVQQVEHLKCLVGVIPVWLSGIACFLVMEQQNTCGLLQAIQMNKQIGSSFKVPSGWMGITSMLALSLCIFIYECIYIPTVQKMITRKPARFSIKQRVGAGIIMSILCMIVAGIVERKRRDSALRHQAFESPMSIAYLLPQFMLAGLTEALAAVAIMDFLTTQMPESMRTVAGAIFFLGLSIASYLSSILVNVIHRLTMKNEKSPWLGGQDLNKNRLDYYYYIIAGIGALNFIYFSFFASRYGLRTNVQHVSSEVQLENSE
ncbi:Proton-dependent oligopeptide transporter family [Dillenia turbinata]|uniref:Proton-dependent oligopeptide transporter family n=1 Tax=Dillenia turbinata TaxID=194707 RepID=A0AAN8Z907_9MAGN